MIFRRTSEPSILRVSGAPGERRVEIATDPRKPQSTTAGARVELASRVDGALAAFYAPACVVVNEALDVVERRGQPSWHAMSAPNLALAMPAVLVRQVRSLIARARSEARPVSGPAMMPANDPGPSQALTVMPLGGEPALFVLVSSAYGGDIFTSQFPHPASELTAARAELRALANQHERVQLEFAAVHEELASKLEELAAGHEDLQSLNEELAAAQEQLVFMNEQLCALSNERAEANERLADVDALKQLVERAQLANREAELANRAKDDFLATLSHELRSPLHSMLVHAQLLRRDGLDAPCLKRSTEAIEACAQLLVKLIDDLLDASRMRRRQFGRPTSLRGVRVLVVDDDYIARQAISEMLSASGAEVHSAGCAAEAMRTLAQFKPEVLLCDIAMPGEDGLTLMRRVRALEDAQLATVPALALTAYARVDDRARAIEAGFHEHLAKPVDVDLLARSLSGLANERRVSPVERSLARA